MSWITPIASAFQTVKFQDAIEKPAYGDLSVLVERIAITHSVTTPKDRWSEPRPARLIAKSVWFGTPQWKVILLFLILVSGGQKGLGVCTLQS